MKEQKRSVPLFRPFFGEEEIAAVGDVLRSGWVGLGPKTEEFDKAFAQYTGAKYSVGTISCTAALDLAIKLLNLSPGDEVIVPGMTFISTGHAVVYNQCRPVFVDSEPDTLNISLEDLQRKITPKTKAIIVVHYSGRPVDLDGVKQIAKGVPVIEDCAHASGAYYKGLHVGTFGRYGCFSFHAVKNLPMGEGGSITIGDADDWQRARQLRWLGIDKGTWERTDKNKDYWWEYGVNEIGLKCHLNDILASIGLVQLGKLADLNARRKEIVETYRRELNGLDWIEMPSEDNADYRSAWHICSIKCKGKDRNDLSLFLKDRGISTGVHYKPIHLYPCYGYQETLPVAEKAFGEILSIPNYPSMAEDDIGYVIETLKEFGSK